MSIDGAERAFQRGLREGIGGSYVLLQNLLENLNWKFRSKLNHGFSNHGCLYYVIMKALYGF